MGSAESNPIVSNPSGTTEALKMTKEKPKCKACCACPETKKERDACIIERGEDQCGDLIEKHKQCMRDLGFKI